MLPPGMSRASTMVKPVVSKLKRIAAISPAGMVDRIVRAWSMPGNDRSSMYFAAPVTFEAPSLRRTLRPTAVVARGIAAIIRRASGGLLEAPLQHADDRRLFAAQRGARARQLHGPGLDRLDRGAVHVGVEDRRVDVAL